MKFSSILPILGAASIASAAMQRRQIDTTTVQTTYATIATTSQVVTTPTPAATTTTAPSAQTTYAQGSDYGYGSSSSGSAVDTDAGASGTGGGGFSLSTGGLVAICLVVAIVAIFGTVTTTLFIIAKRRQWTMRQTLRRASRRLTGRGGQRQAAMDRQSKRVGLQMNAQPARQGHKRGLVVEVNDVETGTASSKPSKLGRVSEKLWRNDWKR